jgi:hypothetical protein
MNQFSIHNIKSGEPLSVLEDVFVPVYFAHRYQVEAAVKLIGGVAYEYETKDGSTADFKEVATSKQHEALRAILKTIDPSTLKIPQNVLGLFPPRAYGYGRTRESFKSQTGVTFDPLTAAATSVDMTFDLLFHPERMNRIVTSNVTATIGDGDSLLTLSTIFDSVSNTVFNSNDAMDPFSASISYRSQEIYINHLMNLIVSSKTNVMVKAIARDQLDKIEKDLSKRGVFQKELLSQIQHFKAHPELFKVKPLPSIPDGSPIGCGYNKF